MNPMGLVFAFAAFGLVSGLGVFIAGNTARGLVSAVRGSGAGGAIMVLNSSLLLIGLAMVFAGGYATYRVIYG